MSNMLPSLQPFMMTKNDIPARVLESSKFLKEFVENLLKWTTLKKEKFLTT
jgi:hypothetical protein